MPPSVRAERFDLSVCAPPPAPSEGPAPLLKKQNSAPQASFLSFFRAKIDLFGLHFMPFKAKFNDFGPISRSTVLNGKQFLSASCSRISKRWRLGRIGWRGNCLPLCERFKTGICTGGRGGETTWSVHWHRMCSRRRRVCVSAGRRSASAAPIASSVTSRDGRRRRRTSLAALNYSW